MAFVSAQVVRAVRHYSVNITVMSQPTQKPQTSSQQVANRFSWRVSWKFWCQSRQRTRRIERREEWFSAQSSCALETSSTKIFQELANQACLAGKANNRFSCQAHMQKSVFSKGLTAPTDSSNSVSVVCITSSQPVFWEFLSHEGFLCLSVRFHCLLPASVW